MQVSILNILLAGVGYKNNCSSKGYILKDNEPELLETALNGIFHRGYHYSDLIKGKLIPVVNQLGNDLAEEGVSVNALSSTTSNTETGSLYYKISMPLKEKKQKIMNKRVAITNIKKMPHF